MHDILEPRPLGQIGETMPHEHVQLAQAPNGEIGPRCHNCGIRLTFGLQWSIINTTSAGITMSKLQVQTPSPSSVKPKRNFT